MKIVNYMYDAFQQGMPGVAWALTCKGVCGGERRSVALMDVIGYSLSAFNKASLASA